MKKVVLSAIAGALLSLSAHAAIEINGDLVDIADLDNSPVSPAAIGADAHAYAAVNINGEVVHVDGDVTQTLPKKSTDTPAVGVDIRSQPEALPNEILAD